MAAPRVSFSDKDLENGDGTQPPTGADRYASLPLRPRPLRAGDGDGVRRTNDG